MGCAIVSAVSRGSISSACRSIPRRPTRRSSRIRAASAPPLLALEGEPQMVLGGLIVVILERFPAALQETPPLRRLSPQSRPSRRRLRLERYRASALDR